MNRIHYKGGSPTPKGATTLISGSYPFLQGTTSSLKDGRSLLLLDEPWHGKTPKCSETVTWRRFKPVHFGGSTLYPVLMGSSGFIFAPKVSILARSIGHVIDHGIRPDPLATPVSSLLTQDYYTSNCLLDPRYLE